MNLENQSLYIKAIDFAKEKHAGQKYGDFDYFEGHLKKVAYRVQELARSLKFPDKDVMTMLIIAFLHDTLEDTDTTEFAIDALFGLDILSGVQLLTRNKNEDKLVYMNRILSHQDISLIKYCDAWVNLEFSAYNGDHKSAKRYVMIMNEINNKWVFLDWYDHIVKIGQ